MSLGPQPAALLPDNVMLSLLGQTLRGTRSLQVALFTFDNESETYSISTAVGFSSAVLDHVREQLVFHAGEERGLVGLVAARREARYVPDCAAEPFWLGEGRTVAIRSSYLAPVVHEDSVPIVFCVLSPHVDGFSAEHRGLIDWGVDFVGRAYAFEVDLRSRLGRLEHQMRDVAIEWDGLRGRLTVALPSGLQNQLKMVSPREWEVIERLQAGQRITTMARELGIRPNTVRNHVKSISRKLGVRSQDELREFIGLLRLGIEVSRRDKR